MATLVCVLFLVTMALAAVTLIVVGVVADAVAPLTRPVSQRRGIRLFSRRVWRAPVSLSLPVAVSPGPSRRAVRKAVHAVRHGGVVKLPGWLITLASQQREVRVLLGRLERAEEESREDARLIVKRAEAKVRLSRRIHCSGQLDAIRSDLGLVVERSSRSAATQRNRANRAARRVVLLASVPQTVVVEEDTWNEDCLALWEASSHNPKNRSRRPNLRCVEGSRAHERVGKELVSRKIEKAALSAHREYLIQLGQIVPAYQEAA